MEKRGAIDFTTLVAIIIGAAILIIVIYGTIRGVSKQGYQSNSAAAKELENLLNPLQAGFADCKKGEISFNERVDIKNVCENYSFGESKLSLKSYGEDELYGVAVGTSSNYVFSKAKMDAETLYTYSCSFNFPYKVADYIVLIPDSIDYCFEGASEDVKELLEPFDYPTVYFEDCEDDLENFVQVGSGGTIDVISLESDLAYGYVVKGDDKLYFVKDTLIPAIFSDSSIYNCVLERLLYRDSILANLYAEKGYLMNLRDCSNSMSSNLQLWKNQLGSSSLGNLFDMSVELDKLNDGASCRIW